MMNVEVSTQIRENYGAHAWDGVGRCPQRWKNKGGEGWVILNAPSIEDAIRFVSFNIVGSDDNYFEEDIVGAKEVPVTHRTWIEECSNVIDVRSRVEWTDRFHRFPNPKSEQAYA